MTEGIMSMLRIFLTVFGVMAALWGIYDIFFGEGGAQSSAGTKKIIGGIAFAALSFFILTAAMNEIKKAEGMAGLTIFANPAIYAEYIPDNK